MLPRKAQNVQPSILIGTQEDASNDGSVAGLCLSPGLKNEESSLLGESCCGGMPSWLAGWSLI